MRQPGVRLLIAAVILLVGITYTHARTPQVTAMAYTGWVRVRTAPDQRTTLVTVTLRSTQSSATDVVNVAFRLQHAPRAFADYVGPATVVYTRTRLTIAVDAHVGWTFVVGPTDSSLEGNDLDYAQTGVAGLAFFWGSLVHDTADTVFDRLVLSPCAGGSAGSCTSCENGEGGDSQCEATCGEGDCQTSCGPGFHACCKCPLSCACCPDIGG